MGVVFVECKKKCKCHCCCHCCFRREEVNSVVSPMVRRRQRPFHCGCGFAAANREED